MVKKANESSPITPEEARFIDSVKRIREKKGWSQGELARYLGDTGTEGFHQTTISRIEKGERPVRLGEARAIARVFGSTVEQMTMSAENSDVVDELVDCVTNLKSARFAIAVDAGSMVTERRKLPALMEKAQQLSLELVQQEDSQLLLVISNALQLAQTLKDLDPVEIVRHEVARHEPRNG